MSSKKISLKRIINVILFVSLLLVPAQNKNKKINCNLRTFRCTVINGPEAYMSKVSDPGMGVDSRLILEETWMM